VRTLVYTHRWLGIALGVLFILWFASGIVMIYARMPVLDPAERLARLAPIAPTTVRTAPGAVAAEASRFTISTLDGRPVYRVTNGGVQQTTFADTGEALELLTADRALQIARAFAGLRHFFSALQQLVTVGVRAQSHNPLRPSQPTMTRLLLGRPGGSQS